MTNFFELPLELKEYINGYADLFTLLQCRLVSKQWKQEVEQFSVLYLMLQNSFPTRCYEAYKTLLEEQKLNTFKLEKVNKNDFENDPFLLILQSFCSIYKQQAIITQKHKTLKEQTKELKNEGIKNLTRSKLLLASLLDPNSLILQNLQSYKSSIVFLIVELSKQFEDTAIYAFQTPDLLKYLGMFKAEFYHTIRIVLSSSKLSKFVLDNPNICSVIVTQAGENKAQILESIERKAQEADGLSDAPAVSI